MHPVLRAGVIGGCAGGGCGGSGSACGLGRVRIRGVREEACGVSGAAWMSLGIVAGACYADSGKAHGVVGRGT